jgi:hypothetical protein
MYSGEYDACDVTLSVYPHQAYRGQAYFSSLPGVDILLRVTSQASISNVSVAFPVTVRF